MRKNPIALVTGGAKRIGKQICIDLAKNSYDIIIHYNKSKVSASELRKEIIELGVRCEIIKCDFNNKKEVDKFYPKATKLLGKISCLINNASVFENDKIHNFTSKSWNKHLDTNLYPPIK
jgi:NAD(P)-dependent dehydrogenase (short-subunit alcohol dehydrogenase family)